MRTDHLINLIAQDRHKPVNLTYALLGAISAGAAVSAVAFFSMLGPRHDISQAIETIRFVFKFVVTLSLFAAAVSLIGPAIRPDGDAGRRRWLLLVAPGLLAASAIVELMVTPAHLWLIKLVGTNALHCLTIIPALSLFPATALFLVMRQGAPSNPGLSGALAGLVSVGIAATLYATNCFDDSPLFVITWYPLATLIVATAGYYAGKRFLRW